MSGKTINGKDTEGSNPNILRRMSKRFFNKMELIDQKRKEFGFDSLSLPEKTCLVVRHKEWGKIEDDIINFDKKLVDNDGIKQ